MENTQNIIIELTVFFFFLHSLCFFPAFTILKGESKEYIMANNNQWQVYLRPNTLTKDNDKDCIADVHLNGATLTNEDVAQRIVSERSEYRKDTIINILNLRDNAVKAFIQECSSFRDGLVQITPRVSGVWENEASAFDPAVHKRTVDLVPTADLRNTLDAISVKVMGTTSAAARISAITDSATGLKDGTITIGDDIIIDGEKIKITDETDQNQGVFIVDATGTEHRVTRRLTVNKPSQIIARVPSSVPAGAVTVKIKTNYSGNKAPLSAIREISYGYECTAV